MNLQFSLIDSDVSAFTVVWPTHRDPPVPSRQASRLERNDGYVLPLLRRNVDRNDNSLDDDIYAIRIGRTDVVAELGVAVAFLSGHVIGDVGQGTREGGGCIQVGNLQRKEAALVRKDERLSRAMSKIEM